jgi:hypothetical protein
MLKIFPVVSRLSVVNMWLNDPSNMFLVELYSRLSGSVFIVDRIVDLRWEILSLGDPTLVQPPSSGSRAVHVNLISVINDPNLYLSAPI